MPLANGAIFAGGRILRLLGAGGMGEAGLQDFRGVWSTVQSVTVLAVTPRDDHSVTVRLRYVMNDGRVDTEDRWLSVVPVAGGLLVYDSERIGAA